jgi:ribosomal protein S18 acetylase RimI-like enzyme
MATAALSNTEFTVVPLAQADMAAVESLLEEQRSEWHELLCWDYTGPSQMIRDVMRQRELPGFAIKLGSTTIGFSFYVIDGDKASIGDIYVSKPWRSFGADRYLATATLKEFEAMSRLRRIESQSVSINNDSANALFLSQGFERFERHYMLVSLSSLSHLFESGATQTSSETSNIIVRDWQDEDFDEATRIIHSSYRGEHDSRINSQYQTEEGCADLLSVLTDHLWCGDFLSDVSRVAVDRATGKPVGVLVASRISAGVGHIGQISIRPNFQGIGVGRRLIYSALDEFDLCGFETVSLAVTASNIYAYRLYQSCGFRTVHTFPVFCKDLRN